MQVHIATPQLELWKFGDRFDNLPHAHDDQIQVTIPIRGGCLFSLENKNYRLTDGHALVLHPKEKHQFRVEDDSSAIVILLREHLLSRQDACYVAEMSVRQRFNPADIDSRFRSWIAGLLASDLTDPLAAEEMETQVLAYLAQQLKGDHSSVPFDANRTPHTADPYISRALDYIHGHYTSRMTIDQLASEALQSRYHFIRMFKRETKLTPYQYVIGLRIGEAKRRLAQTRETVTEISYSLGFASTSQFHRAFLKAVGLTPEQFRKG